MVSRKILKSHPVSVLKKEISKTNIKGYSKMKKPELIDLMTKPEHADRFAHIEMAPSRAEKKAQKEKNAKSQKEGDDFLKREEERMKKEEEAKKKGKKKPPLKLTSFTVTKADGSKKEVKTGRVKRRAEEKKAKKSSAEDDSKNMLKMMLKEQQAELAKLKKSKASKDVIKQKTELIGTIKLGIKSGFID